MFAQNDCAVFMAHLFLCRFGLTELSVDSSSILSVTTSRFPDMFVSIMKLRVRVPLGLSSSSPLHTSKKWFYIHMQVCTGKNLAIAFNKHLFWVQFGLGARVQPILLFIMILILISLLQHHACP